MHLRIDKRRNAKQGREGRGPFPPYKTASLQKDPTPNMCQVFILYSAWGFILSPTKSGTTRKARLEKRQQRPKGEANLRPPIFSLKKTTNICGEKKS